MEEINNPKKSKLSFFLYLIGTIVLVLLVLYIIWLNLFINSINSELNICKENNAHPCPENSLLRCIPESKMDYSLSNCKNNEVEICAEANSNYIKCNNSETAICLGKGINSAYNDASWENYNHGLIQCKNNETASCVDYKKWTLIDCKKDETPTCINFKENAICPTS